jgi:hypothetical protein
MAKYILESFKQFRDEYIRIQDEIDKLKSQIHALEISRKDSIINSRKEFIRIFDRLKKKAYKNWHQNINQYSRRSGFQYDFNFEVRNKEQILEIIEELILALEDLFYQNKNVRLSIAIWAKAATGLYTFILDTDDDSEINVNEFNGISDLGFKLFLIEDSNDERGKPIYDVIFIMNKVEEEISTKLYL